MAKKLYWLDVLNEQAQWEDETKKCQWLTNIFGPSAQISDEVLRYFDEACQLMRSSFDSLHFGEKLPLDRLDQMLASVHPKVVIEEFLPASVQVVLPIFHARVLGRDDDQILQAITNTLLLQFSQFVSAADQTPQVSRCQGIVKHSRNTQTLMGRFSLTESELRWRQELELLTDHDLLESPDIERCADLFIASPKARFCSDACRFSTFQFAKYLGSPDYHAEKQKRYRTKLSDSPSSSGRKDKRTANIDDNEYGYPRTIKRITQA